MLCIASANAINQYLEVDTDIMMRRTQLRMLPAGEMSLNHALVFGVATGVAGTVVLAYFTNPLSAALAFGNILLYTLCYTPLKRVHWLNTWVGAVVGGIPPLIGWAARTGDLSLASIPLAYALLVWQIPHFLALSWPLEADYRKAGYKMLVSQDAPKVARLTLRYSAYLLLVAPMAYYLNVCDGWFLVTGTALNVWLCAKAYPFARDKNSATARKVFMATLYYLPILIVLMLLHKTRDESDMEDDEVDEGKEGIELVELPLGTSSET